MHSSARVWGLLVVSSFVAACGDDGAGTSSGDGGSGGATTASTTTAATAATTTASTASGEGGEGTTVATTTTSGTGGEGGGTGGQGTGGEGGSAPVCGDRVVAGDEACDGPDGLPACADVPSLELWFGEVGCTDGCELDLRGCFGPEVCDDGLDNDLDGDVDCGDLACPEVDSCDTSKGTVETDCSSFTDDDGDDLVDCADPDCQALPACAPGDGAVGEPCLAHVDCEATAGDDPTCVSAARSNGNMPGGYCTEQCDVEDDDCPAGSLCVGFSDVAICLVECADSGDCRPGYECTSGVCYVGVGGEVCDNDVDDDGDGFVDCIDGDCALDASCAGVETSCGDLLDNDADDVYDCADTTACSATALCEPGDRPVGAPCTNPSDCAAVDGGAPACIESQSYPGGYCSGWCEEDADCPAGSHCGAPFANLCFDDCSSLYDCRPGQLCAPYAGDGCVGFAGELCGNLRDDDGDGLLDCADPACAEEVACTGPEEDDCNDLEDDDQDGFVDCADVTSCRDTSDDCVPGDGALGDPCVTNTACAALDGAPLCLTEAAGFPDGMCSEWCDYAVGCGDDGACLPVPFDNILVGACWTSCLSIDDCRDGYECVEDADLHGETVFVCAPAVE
jgi:hypothetical protein